MSDTFNAPLSEVDPEIAAVLEHELGRQRGTLEMIASENFVPARRARGAGLGAHQQVRRGLPRPPLLRRLRVRRRRRDARDRARQVRCSAPSSRTCSRTPAPRPTPRCSPRSRAPATASSGLELAHGGHLTHGMKLNFSGKLYEAHAYGVDPETFLVDMDVVREQGARGQARRCSSPAGRPTRASSTSPRSARSPTRSARCSGSTWRTSPASSPPACTRRPVPHAHVTSSTVHKTIGGPRSGFILTNDARPGEEDQLERLPRPAGRPAHARDRGQGDGVQARGDAGVQGPPGAHHARRRTSSPSGSRSRTRRPPASTCSPAAPTCTSCSSTCATRRSTARRPRTCCTRSASR